MSQSLYKLLQFSYVIHIKIFIFLGRYLYYVTFPYKLLAYNLMCLQLNNPIRKLHVSWYLFYTIVYKKFYSCKKFYFEACRSSIKETRYYLSHTFYFLSRYISFDDSNYHSQPKHISGWKITYLIKITPILFGLWGW